MEVSEAEAKTLLFCLFHLLHDQIRHQYTYLFLHLVISTETFYSISISILRWSKKSDSYICDVNHNSVIIDFHWALQSRVWCIDIDSARSPRSVDMKLNMQMLLLIPHLSPAPAPPAPQNARHQEYLFGSTHQYFNFNHWITRRQYQRVENHGWNI